jgi:ribonuclease VapC
MPSALLALLREEPGAEAVAAVIDGALVSTVNASETIAKLIQRGAGTEEAEEIVLSLPLETRAFELTDAARAGKMWPRGRAIGLSLGDRACLALAESLSLPVMSTDSRWRSFETSIEIRLLR